MIGRWFFGRHPVDGSYGAWLSRPGVEVLSTTSPDAMLISPLKKNEQFLTTGVIFVPNGESRPIYYPETYNSIPFVQISINTYPGALTYPAAYEDYDGNGMVYVNQANYAAFVQNLTNKSIYVYYTICARSD